MDTFYAKSKGKAYHTKEYCGSFTAAQRRMDGGKKYRVKEITLETANLRRLKPCAHCMK